MRRGCRRGARRKRDGKGNKESMGMLATLLERRSEKQQLSGWNDPALEYFTGGGPTASGVSVNENSALKIAAV
jgi:hypothetical protein